MSLTNRKPIKKQKDIIKIATGSSDIYLDTRDSITNENHNGETIISGKDYLPFFDMKDHKGGIRALFSGSTGSGKTYMAEKLIECIKPSVIYVFSSIDDGDYSKYKNVQRFDLNELIANTGLDIHTIYEYMEPNCVAIFDDIVSFGSKLAKPYIELRLIMLQKSRHKGQSVFICEQSALAGMAKGAREVLLNCQYFYCFPKSNFNSFNKLATNYLGLDKKQIEKLKNLKSRYVMINKNAPSYYISSVECGML
jgi:hypothetical protein